MSFDDDREERNATVNGMLAHARASAGSTWVKVECEFCPYRVGTQDSGKSFAFNRASTGYFCHRCGVKGYLESQPEHFAAVPIGASENQLARLKRPPRGFVPLWEEPGASSFVTEKARAYLLSRGIGPELWKQASIGFCTEENEKVAFGRIIVPVLVQGGWMGWSGRLPGRRVPKKDKYRTAPFMPRESILYNHDALHVTTEDPLYVVEGAFDALHFWPDAVAAFGDVTEEHLHALKYARRPVVLIGDGDAWEKSLMWAMRLRIEGQRAGAIRLPPLTDPDEVPNEDVWEAGRSSLVSSREVRL